MSRLDRQSFLGIQSDETLQKATWGFVGLGGGGSHLIQQAVHLGIGGFVPVDPDIAEDTNTNRLIGCTWDDVVHKRPKVRLAERMIRALQPHARVQPIQDSWHSAVNALKISNILFGAVDTFMQREQLERFARRHLIPYIDVGMDVHRLPDGTFLIAGQVILSMPGGPCLRCCNFITDERIAQEANQYGAAGGRPQVVWPNGVLASSAIGLGVQLMTPWVANVPRFAYLEYDGNRGTVVQSRYMKELAKRECPHYRAQETGDPQFDVREFRRYKD